MTKRRWLALVLAAAAVLLVVGRALASLYVDFHWYAAMGAESVWRAKTENTLLLRGVSAAAGSLFLFANLYAVRQSVMSVRLPRRVANLEIAEEVPGQYLILAVAGLSVALGVLLTTLQDDWTVLGRARYGVPFDERDPYLQLDLGFFVYWVPFETSLYLWALIAFLLATAVVVFLYALTPSLRWERGSLHLSGYVRRHLTVLGALLLFILAWSYRLDAYGMLSSGSGDAGAFTSIDHRVIVPVSLVLAVLTLGAGLLVLYAGWRGQTRLVFGTVTTVLALSLLLRQVLPLITEQLARPGDPAARERPYLATRAGYTRRAYGADGISHVDSSVAFATPRELAQGVAMWDEPALARALERAPLGRSIAGVSWRGSPAGIVGVAVARPGASDATGALPPWAAVTVLAATADERGGVVRPAAVGAAREEEITLPVAIVSDSTSGYAIVADSAGELPAAPIAGWGSRLAHAWSEQNFRLLFGDLPRPDPRIVLRRGVRERVAALAPFFAQGAQTTPVVVNDSLYWVLHLYSASADYPLSQHFRLAAQEWSYFQHAAVAVVYAATGRVTIVADSALDPVADSWVKQFPEIFSRPTALPRGVAAAFPPAEDGVRAQGVAFARYGTRAESSAPRRVALIDHGDTLLAAAAAPGLALPASDGAAAITLPVVDRDDRVVGAVIGAGGPGHETFWYPLAAPGARWTEVVDRLQRAPDSAATLPRDARLIRGRIRAVPFQGGLAFAQPTFSWRADGASLARVALLVRDSLSAGRTLADAEGLAWPPATASAAAPGTPADFRARVESLYEAMRGALARGDFKTFGAAYEELGRLLGKRPR